MKQRESDEKAAWMKKAQEFIEKLENMSEGSVAIALDLSVPGRARFLVKADSLLRLADELERIRETKTDC